MSYNNSHMGSNPPARTGLSVQELKQLTALRMSQTNPQHDTKTRQPSKELSGHPPRNPLNAQAAPRQPAAVPYPAPQLESKPKNRVDPPHSHSKSNKNKGHGRSSPVDSSFAVKPQGLTVQELKELTRMRLAREAVTAYSPETSEYSDARTHTTSATFRSGYTAGDVDSYSDSGSVPRNRSTSTSPISNTDSDSFDDGYSRYPPYHPPVPISPSSVNRSERDRHLPYSPDHSSPSVPSAQSPFNSPRHSLPTQTPPQVPVYINNNCNNNQKTFAGIHPGLQSPSISVLHSQTQPSKSPREFSSDSQLMNHHHDRTFTQEDHSHMFQQQLQQQLPQQQHTISDTAPQVFYSINSGNTQNIRPPLINHTPTTTTIPIMEREREPIIPTLGGSSGIGGNSLRKFALTNTMNNLEGGLESLNSASPTPPLNPLFSFTSPSVGELSPPGSPQRSFRGKKKLVIDCPAPVRIRSTSDCNELAFEMAEAVLNSPGPNSPMNGAKPIWSDPPSRRTSVCSVLSDTGIVNGVLHDSTGIGLSIPAMLAAESEDQNQNDDGWKVDLDPSTKKPHLSHSPVTLQTLSKAFPSVPIDEQFPDGHTTTTPSEFHWK